MKRGRMGGVIGDALRAMLTLAALPAPLVARAKCLLPASERSRAVVHVIGDSHVTMFSGTDEMVNPWPASSRDPSGMFRAYRLGPALAYRLPDLNSASRGREKLLVTLAYGPVPSRGTVMLCFGEIDCRYHLLKQAELQERDLQDVVGECVARYARVVLEVQAMGFTTCAWGVIPANEVGPEEAGADYPSWGTAEQRNAVSVEFNRALADQLEPHGVPVIDIFDRLVGRDGRPMLEFYMDSVHLSRAALPLAIEALVARHLVPSTQRRSTQPRNSP